MSASNISRRPWKMPPVRSHQNPKSWLLRMEKTQKDAAIKKLQQDLRQEKMDALGRNREISKERREAAEDRKRLEDAKSQMGARKAARLRRKAGRTKKIHH